MKVLDLATALQKAYRLLSLRPHSEKELGKKLREKGFPAVVIKEALEKLHDLKYLNDASFAVQWARNLAVNKLWGNRKIIASLQEKGVWAQLINDAVTAARLEISEEEAIAILVKKRAAKKKSAAFDIKEKQRIFQSLMGRGFPPGLILNKIGKAAEEEFNGEDG
ncbi:MAG: regulatory protein RecX [Smithellaceae bacterium]|nr:regulatory protein RecX [Smithellaceae bacterium]